MIHLDLGLRLYFLSCLEPNRGKLGVLLLRTWLSVDLLGCKHLFKHEGD